MENVTIVIPIFNDQESVDELCSQINEITTDHATFLIVDNGSINEIKIPPTKNTRLIRTEKIMDLVEVFYLEFNLLQLKKSAGCQEI